MNNVDREYMIFQSHIPRLTEFGTARGIEAYRNSDGSVPIRISSETEYADAKHKTYTLSAQEAEEFGRMLLCQSEEKNFVAIINRATNIDERNKRGD